MSHWNKISYKTGTKSYSTLEQHSIPHRSKISYHIEIKFDTTTEAKCHTIFEQNLIPQHWAKCHTTLQHNFIPLHLGKISYYTGIKIHIILEHSLSYYTGVIPYNKLLLVFRHYFFLSSHNVMALSNYFSIRNLFGKPETTLVVP